MNRIRRENPALQSNRRPATSTRLDNDQLIAYSKSRADWQDVVLVVVNLDPHHAHSGWCRPATSSELGSTTHQPFQVHDLLTERYLWQGARNFVELRPADLPAHIFRVRRRLRTEHDFDYYL